MNRQYNDERLSIRQLAEDDRPREKFQLKGRNAMSNAELMAILLGSGNRTQTAVELAQHILNDQKERLRNISKQSISDLMKYTGIGLAKAVSILAALELGKRMELQPAESKRRISSSIDGFECLKGDLSGLPTEEFWVVLLNRANHVIDKVRISQGGVTGTIVDAKVLFKRALEQYSVSIILAHNHPSGSLKPSQADIKLTKKMVEAGKVLDIQILDHLIVTDSDYFSFADEGLI